MVTGHDSVWPKSVCAGVLDQGDQPVSGTEGSRLSSAVPMDSVAVGVMRMCLVIQDATQKD